MKKRESKFCMVPDCLKKPETEELCSPCWDFIMRGVVNDSQAARNALNSLKGVIKLLMSINEADK
jgi:hypothetical protein